jgi:zinc protease
LQTPGLVHERLDNGAQIVVLPVESTVGGPGIAAVQLWVMSGTADERPGELGCAHLLEHLLFKPATLPDGRLMDITEAVEALGGEINAYTSLDETVIHATVLAVGALDAIDAIVGPVLHPRFDPAELAAEAEVVVEEIRQDHDDPAACIAQDVAAASFAGHGYARSVLGSIRDVRRHDVARLRKFHRRAYAGRRLVLVVAGAVDVDDVLARGRAWLQSRPVGQAPGPRGELTWRTRPAVRVHRRDVRDVALMFGWAAPPLPVDDACALEVAAVVLGYGEASRISTRLRRGQGLVTDGQATLYAYRRASSLSVGARVVPGAIEPAVEALFDQVAALTRTPVSDEELGRAKAVLRSEQIYRAETMSGRAHALGYFLSLGGSLATEAAYFAALDRVDAAQVRSAAARWLDPRAAALSVVLPKAEFSAQEARTLRTGWAARLRRRPARAKAQRGRKGRPERFTHRSGVRVCLWPDDTVAVTAGWWMWPGGQRIETPRTSGWGPLAAELLTRGCAAIDGDALAREIEGRAAVLDGFCGRNSAGVHFECVAPDLEHVLTRALQCVVAPRFDAAELDEQRRLTLEVIAAQDDDLAGVAVRAAAAARYGRHPYGMRRKGSEQSLRGATARHVASWWSRAYPLPSSVLGLAGAIDVEQVIGCLDAVLPERATARPDRTLSGKAPAAGRRPRRIAVAPGRARSQAHIVVAFPGLAMGDLRAPALDILMTVLGGQVGRLFMALREREGLVYHVSASSSEGIDAGDIMLYAATARGKVERTIAAIERELLRVRTEPIEARELAHAKAVLAGEFAGDLERRSRLASAIAFDEAFGLPSFQRYPARVAAVTSRAVATLAATLLDPARALTVVAGG